MNEQMNEQQGVVSGILQHLQNDSIDQDANFTLQPEASEDMPSGEIIDLGGPFDYEGYQVVRREFFALTNEPSITFNNFKVYVNTACLNRLPHVDYVQVLVNRDRKILAIRPCHEEERDAFVWCSTGAGKRKPKQITCRLFFAKVFDLMGWNPDHRYKLLGKVIHANDEYLIAFDLSATEVYQRITKDGEKPKSSRKPVFPEGWQEQFGLPFLEHQKSLQVNIFDGYAIYGIKENSISQVDEQREADGTAEAPVLDMLLGGSWNG